MLGGVAVGVLAGVLVASASAYWSRLVLPLGIRSCRRGRRRIRGRGRCVLVGGTAVAVAVGVLVAVAVAVGVFVAVAVAVLVAVAVAVACWLAEPGSAWPLVWLSGYR